MTDHRAGAGAGATPAGPPGEKFSTYEWQEVCRRARMGRTYTSLAIVMSTYADPDGTKVYPGIAGLCFDAELSYNKVKEFLVYLQQVGLLAFVRRRYNQHGERISDEYRLVLDWKKTSTASRDPDIDFWLPDPDQRKAGVTRINELKRGKHKTAAADVDEPDAPVDGVPVETVSAVDITDLAAHGTGRSIQDLAAHGTGRSIEVAAHGEVDPAARAVCANQATDRTITSTTEPETTSPSSQRPPSQGVVHSGERRHRHERVIRTGAPPNRLPAARRRGPTRPAAGPGRRGHTHRVTSGPPRRRTTRLAAWLRSTLRRAGRRRHRGDPGRASPARSVAP